MVYLDANILIYLFENHPLYGQKVAEIISDFQKDHEFACSSMTITECLAQVTDISLETFRRLPKLHIVPLDELIAAEAGRIQRETTLRIGDAIHLATARQQKSSLLFTNDKKFAKIASSYIKVKGVS